MTASKKKPALSSTLEFGVSYLDDLEAFSTLFVDDGMEPMFFPLEYISYSPVESLQDLHTPTPKGWPRIESFLAQYFPNHANLTKFTLVWKLADHNNAQFEEDDDLLWLKYEKGFVTIGVSNTFEDQRLAARQIGKLTRELVKEIRRPIVYRDWRLIVSAGLPLGVLPNIVSPLDRPLLFFSIVIPLSILGWYWYQRDNVLILRRSIDSVIHLRRLRLSRYVVWLLAIAVGVLVVRIANFLFSLY